MEDDVKKARLLMVLSKHVGSSRSISMTRLFEEVFEQPWSDKINDTRRIRELITALRKDGIPIVSTVDRGGGYFLAGAGSELETYCSRLRRRAMRILAMEAKLRNMTLPELIGQLGLEARGKDGRDG